MPEPVLDAPEKPKEGAVTKDAPPLEKPEAGKDGQPAEKKTDAAASPEKPKESLLDKPEDKKAAEEAAKAAEAAKVPDKYADFKAPEGVQLDADMVQKFDVKAKELGLSQANRDALIQMQVEHTQAQVKQTMDVFHKQIADWTAETKKELGAETDKALATSSKGIDTVFPDAKENKAFRDMMKETGLGNWNLMVRLTSHIGNLVKEDKLVPGSTAKTERKSDAEVMHDHPTSRAA